MKKFIALYILYITLAFLLIEYEPLRNLLALDATYTATIVKLSAWLIEALNMSVIIDGERLILNNAVLVVKFGCNGLEAVLLYMAGLLAFPATLKQKSIGLLIGIIALEFINIWRIALLAYVITNHNNIFDIMHDYITQSIMIALSFILFLTYLQTVSNEKNI